MTTLSDKPRSNEWNLFRAIFEAAHDDHATKQEISRIAAELPVPTPPPVQLLSPRREPVLKPQNDKERTDRVTAYLDGCQERPSSNSVATACAVSFAYAKKRIGQRFPGTPESVEASYGWRNTTESHWDLIEELAMSGGY